MTFGRPRCGCRGKAFPTEEAALIALDKIRAKNVRFDGKLPTGVRECLHKQWHHTGDGRPSTDPDKATKDLILVRDDWHCACCGRPLFDEGSEYCRQHRVARKMGGSRRPVINSPANLVLLCGLPTTAGSCNYRAEGRVDLEMHLNGFWLHDDQDPCTVPVKHFSRGWVLLDMAGGWSSVKAPAGAR